jgi:hypothetical protein
MKAAAYKEIDATIKIAALARAVLKKDSHTTLESIVADESETLDTKSERWRESEKGVEETERVEKLTAVYVAYEDLLDALTRLEEELTEMQEISPEGAYNFATTKKTINHHTTSNSTYTRYNYLDHYGPTNIFISNDYYQQRSYRDSLWNKYTSNS